MEGFGIGPGGNGKLGGEGRMGTGESETGEFNAVVLVMGVAADWGRKTILGLVEGTHRNRLTWCHSIISDTPSNGKNA